MPVVAMPDATPPADAGRRGRRARRRLADGTSRAATRAGACPTLVDRAETHRQRCAEARLRPPAGRRPGRHLRGRRPRRSPAGRRSRSSSIACGSTATCAARLTDSIETSYREGGGAAFAVELARRRRPPAQHVFSERFECRRCGIAYEDPQPRLFSFNNPFGACPTCHGFGNVIELDMDLVVPDRDQVDPPGRDRALDQAALQGAARGAEARGEEARHPRSTCRGRT